MPRGLRFAAVLLFLLPVQAFAAAPTAQQSADPFIRGLLEQVSRDDFLNIDKGLSGAIPVKIGGEDVTLQTRYTPSAKGTLAEQYVYEYFQSLGLQTVYQPWTGDRPPCSGIKGRNVVAEIRGSKDPSRIYIFSAHMDSTAPHPDTAPGADDNGSGTTAVMLAARILGKYSFDYTLRFVAFTGEERGLCGSTKYAAEARAKGEDIEGVINADMIAYDSDGVKDVELHAGLRPDSQAIANAAVGNIRAYGLNLIPHVLTDKATDRSDHASFWNNNYPAITTAEDFFTGDPNPYYHSITCCDTWDHLDTGMATDYTRAIIATIAGEAGIHQAAPPTPTPSPTPIPVLPIPGEGSRTFPETGKTVTGIFLDYWNNNGGLSQIGLPISDLRGELSQLNGKPYTVQYFERAVMEYHPENQPPFNVLLSQLGTYQYKKKYGSTPPDQRPDTSADAVLVPETGKHLGGRFLAYWRSHGGLIEQGYPISEEFTEVSPLDGKAYTVQYFERAVFEYHPENQPPYDVLLSQLGTFLYHQKYP